MEFELDARNLKHFREDHPERGITREVLDGVANLDPKLFENEPRANRTGTHLVVGPDTTGRMWTIVVLKVMGDKWRPITGWLSTGTEIRRHGETN